ncbi:HIT family protein [Candidatus Woesearchaeota archaeon]|nr:HIT family protein [Candidatus Woesearchaeota archaeon]
MEKKLTPEQIAELKEKIKNMSPEELKEFQKKQCIFCQIVEGRVSAKKVYEDEVSIAILDINPANPGHILLMPREHYTILPQVPESEINHLAAVAKKLSNAVLRALDAKGTNIIVANGVAAGQKAQHMMIHIIPRKEKDSVAFSIPQKEHSMEELDSVQKRLAQKFGTVAEERQVPKPKEVEAEIKEEKPGKVDLDEISSLFSGRKK